MNVRVCMHFELPYSNYLVRIYEKSSTSYYVKAIPLPSGLKKNFSKKEEKENSLKTCVSKFDFKKLKAINVLISNDKAFFRHLTTYIRIKDVPTTKLLFSKASFI